MTPDGRLVFAVNLPSPPLAVTARVAVICLVDIRSDKLALDQHDDPHHVFGGKLLSGAIALEGSDLFDTLAVHIADATGEGIQLALTTPEPARYVEGADSVAMSPVELGGTRHDVKLAELQELELAPGRFYEAAHKLKGGATLNEATQGFTTPQRDYVKSFMPRPKRRTTPQETNT